MRKYFKKRYVLPAIAAGFLFVGMSFRDNFFEVAKQIEIFTMVFKELDKNYVDEINPGDLMDKAIKSMLADLDPYTNFFNEADVVKFKINNTGEYTGIGAMITRVETKLIVKEAYNIVKGVAPYIIIGIAIGGLMHGFIPTGFFEALLQEK